MPFIYQADSNRFKQENSLKDLLGELPGNMHERAFRYKFEQDAYNYVVGRLLLKKGLEKFGMGKQLEHIAYQKDDKPFLDGVFFNISHTENLVVCAISTKGAIGIDVEKEKAVVLKNFKSWFTVQEWVDITNAPSPIGKFYWYWTRKESIIKALGVKLSYMNKIELDSTQDFFMENGKKYYLKDLDFGSGFFGALCAEKAINEIKIVDLLFKR